MDALHSMLMYLDDYIFAFDMTFFKDEVLTATVSEYLSTQRSCFENARTTSLGNSKYQITLISTSSNCRLDFSVNNYITVSGV